mmetsp:Transcript_3588/g.10107  ORF Transcript_3588/g.10107 Transcript_3588/m.10107 type:complete len:223 (+) Transcript_3588:914-1582(+)
MRMSSRKSCSGAIANVAASSLLERGLSWRVSISVVSVVLACASTSSSASSRAPRIHRYNKKQGRVLASSPVPLSSASFSCSIVSRVTPVSRYPSAMDNNRADRSDSDASSLSMVFFFVCVAVAVAVVVVVFVCVSVTVTLAGLVQDTPGTRDVASASQNARRGPQPGLGSVVPSRCGGRGHEHGRGHTVAQIGNDLFVFDRGGRIPEQALEAPGLGQPPRRC